MSAAKPTPNAIRLRRWRARQTLGKAVINVEVDLFNHTEMLIASGLLKAWDDSNRALIEDATARLLRALASEMRNGSSVFAAL
jgi:hypothetical protein